MATCRWHVATARLFRRKANPDYNDEITTKGAIQRVVFLFGMVFRRRDLKGGSWQHAGGMLQPPGFSAEKQILIITMKRLPKGRPERCVFFVWHGIQKEGFEGRLLATCRWHVATARLFRRKANPDYNDEITTKGAIQRVVFLFGMVFRRRDLKDGSWQHAGGMLQPPGFSAEKKILIITMKRLPKGRPERCVFFVWHGLQEESVDNTFFLCHN